MEIEFLLGELNSTVKALHEGVKDNATLSREQTAETRKQISSLSESVDKFVQATEKRLIEGEEIMKDHTKELVSLRQNLIWGLATVSFAIVTVGLSALTNNSTITWLGIGTTVLSGLSRIAIKS